MDLKFIERHQWLSMLLLNASGKIYSSWSIGVVDFLEKDPFKLIRVLQLPTLFSDSWGPFLLPVQMHPAQRTQPRLFQLIVKLFFWRGYKS